MTQTHADQIKRLVEKVERLSGPDRSVGRVAFESLSTHSIYPPREGHCRKSWHELSDHDQKTWEAVARDVLAHRKGST